MGRQYWEVKKGFSQWLILSRIRCMSQMDPTCARRHGNGTGRTIYNSTNIYLKETPLGRDSRKSEEDKEADTFCLLCTCSTGWTCVNSADNGAEQGQTTEHQRLPQAKTNGVLTRVQGG